MSEPGEIDQEELLLPESVSDFSFPESPEFVEDVDPGEPVELEEDQESLDTDALHQEIIQQGDVYGGGELDLIGIYFQQAKAARLLTQREEVELSKRIEEGINASKKLAEGKSRGRPLRERTILELERTRNDGLQASEIFINSNLRLVISIAKRYMGRGIPFLDLIQDGNVGLMIAASKFDYRRGFKFSTYATWWIRQSITRGISNNGRTIRMPVHMIERVNAMYKAIHAFKQSNHKDPTAEEIASLIGLPVKYTEQLIQISLHNLSLDAEILRRDGDEGGSSLSDFVPDSSVDLDRDVKASLLQDEVEEVLDTLTPIEQLVLVYRFGLKERKAMTLEEVGTKFNLTRERIRQIEGKALRRLRHPLHSHKLKKYYDED